VAQGRDRTKRDPEHAAGDPAHRHQNCRVQQPRLDEPPHRLAVGETRPEAADWETREPPQYWDTSLD